MSKRIGPKGRNHAARPRKNPTTCDIARHIETGRKLWSIRPIMGNILPAKKNEEADNGD
jgi:hypothetical protein